MAQVIWGESALRDLDGIASYVAVANPVAASELVKRVFAHTDQLNRHPLSGSVIPEARKRTTLYRQIVEPPCRIFYRVDGDRVLILWVIRGEMSFRRGILRARYDSFSDPNASEDPR